jgi:hypothetical protein
MIHDYDDGRIIPETQPLYAVANNLQQANSCSSEHSKLCFLQHGILRASRNKLATRLKARGDLLQSRKSCEDDYQEPNIASMTDDNKNRKKKAVGRKPKKNPSKYRYTVNLNDEENDKFRLLLEQSGADNISRFIHYALFGKEIKIVKVDKATMDYYIRLTNFHHQFQAIGNNYNQTVKALKTNFSEKRALALLYKLEKATIELIFLSKQIIALTREYEERWLQK